MATLDIDVNDTLGAILIGFAVSSLLYGVLCSQVYSYVRRYPYDRAQYKWLVLVVLLLETADQALIGHVVYFYTIVNFDNLVTLVEARTIWCVLQLTIGAVVGAIVKLCYGMRVYRFSGNNAYITAVIVRLPHSTLVHSHVALCRFFKLSSVFEVINLKVLGTTSLGVGVLTDIVTATALCFYLSRMRTGHSTSDSLIKSLARYAINTGVVTSTMSISTVVLFNAMPSKFYFMATYFTLSKLYATSLNTRKIVKGRGTDRQGTTTRPVTNLFDGGTRVQAVFPPDRESWIMTAVPVQQSTSSMHLS
ncbi:hypothetical protein FISHEDRAFT_46852 [Fistulina hepatica ATCC 64428]|uniref:DUF6534 domain-containing protein n=1 Tax=Fistulina hepatica ATCC 64428 TaxID=1128425 RepID=A0A0D7A7G8_9AGAR|nr:hypothetical protein FISHEDRAFT_46852 [Fistulina hepatica ATCC 64428]